MLRMLSKTLERMAIPYLIIVVDGNSPDNTANIARATNVPNLIVIDEKCKNGLGNSYVKGLKYCIYEHTVILDADLQHDPNSIPIMYKVATSGKFDIVTGTRYKDSGMVCGWPFLRKLVSLGSNNVARYVLGLKSSDLNGSFRCYRTDVLKKLLSETRCKGFGFQMEIIARAELKKYKIAEVPIVFYDRIAGESKLRMVEMLKYLFAVFILYFTA